MPSDSIQIRPRRNGLTGNDPGRRCALARLVEDFQIDSDSSACLRSQNFISPIGTSFTGRLLGTTEVTEATTRLADAGVPLGSQTVLLKDINDSVDTLKTLYHGLLKRRVRPYYLYQCDPISGSSHFRTSVDKGLEIMQGLRGHTTGYAVPTYVIDAPGGGGKIPLLPDYVQGRDGDDLILKNFEGKIYRYTDPQGTVGASAENL